MLRCSGRPHHCLWTILGEDCKTRTQWQCHRKHRKPTGGWTAMKKSSFVGLTSFVSIACKQIGTQMSTCVVFLYSKWGYSHWRKCWLAPLGTDHCSSESCSVTKRQALVETATLLSCLPLSHPALFTSSEGFSSFKCLLRKCLSQALPLRNLTSGCPNPP